MNTWTLFTSELTSYPFFSLINPWQEIFSDNQNLSAKKTLGELVGTRLDSLGQEPQRRRLRRVQDQKD